MKRKVRSRDLLVVLMSTFALQGCGNEGTHKPSTEQLSSFSITAPTTVDAGVPFTIVVTAVGSKGASPFGRFDGVVTLTLTEGSVSPDTLLLEDGIGAGDVSLSGSGTLTLTASCDGKTGTVTLEVASGYQPGGLMATYSNGAQMVEAPIRHGWSWDCEDTGYNLYQGTCTPVSELPVGWAASSNFSVTWNGFLIPPVTGEYVFSAWVDGAVTIEIDGHEIVNINTPGSGYSGRATLTENVPAPITMTFAANGGSNNVQLRWTPPGRSAELVPASCMGYESTE